MTHGLPARLRRLESWHAEERKRREESWHAWVDGMLRAYSAPPWSREQEWSELDRLAARVVAHTEVREAFLILAARPDASPGPRLILELGEQLARRWADGSETRG